MAVKSTAIGMGKWEIEVRDVAAIYQQQVQVEDMLKKWCPDLNYEQFMSPLTGVAWLKHLLYDHTFGKSTRVRLRIWSPDKKRRWLYIGYMDKAWEWWDAICDQAFVLDYAKQAKDAALAVIAQEIADTIDQQVLQAA